MKKLLILLTLLPLTLLAKVNIAVAYPYIGAVTEKIGAGNVNVSVLAPGSWDPHFVVPRPSLIAKLRRADALVINGAQLEIGWLPALIKRANNASVQPGSPGFLDLSKQLELIEKPQAVSRAQGDVHPDGNPHFHLDPNNMLLIASAIKSLLTQIDPVNKELFQTNYKAFEKSWKANLKRWNERMKPHHGKKVIQYHKSFDYFFKAYALESIGTIEPLPGIPPSSKHTFKLVSTIKSEHPCCILHDVYHSTKTADYIAGKTGIRVITIPHDIGALDSITTLEELFDYLTKAVADD